jgi:hypothetical protein
MAPKVGSAIRFRRTVRRKSVAPAGGFGSCASGIPPVDTGGKRSGAPFGGLPLFSRRLDGQAVEADPGSAEICQHHRPAGRDDACCHDAAGWSEKTQAKMSESESQHRQ